MKKEQNQLRTGIILNYVNMILGNIIPIMYTPIMLSLLGKSEYGLYKLSSNVTSYLTLISMGIGSSVLRYLIDARINQGKKEEEEVLGLFMIIFLVIAMVSFLLGIWLTLNIQMIYGNSLNIQELSRMRLLIFIMVCNTSLSFSFTPYISIVSAHERFIFFQGMNIIATCLGPIINLVMLFLGFQSIGMAISTLTLEVIVRFLYFIFVKKYMKIKARYTNLSISLLKNILKFSFWIFIGNLVGQLFNATDTAMIGAIPSLGTEGVAVYNVGLTLNTMMLTLTTGVSTVMSPKVNNMVLGGSNEKELTDLSIKVGRLQCYVMALIVTGFIVFGQPFIYYYAGLDYKDAYWVAILMMIPNMIPLAQSICSSIIVAQNKHKFRSIVYLIIALINVIGTWFLMKKFGIIGAALMTGVSLVLGQGIAMNWYYKVKSGIEIGRFWKEVGITYVMPIVLCSIFIFLSYWIDFYNLKLFISGIIIYTSMYFTLLWFFILNDYEKNLILVPLHKILKKYERIKI